MVEIQQKDDGKRGAFYISRDQHMLAEMSYVWTGEDKIIIDHTEVSDELRGQGAGKQLVAKAVEFARDRGLRILPLCPFAKSVLFRNKEYRDVL